MRLSVLGVAQEARNNARRRWEHTPFFVIMVSHNKHHMCMYFYTEYGVCTSRHTYTSSMIMIRTTIIRNIFE